MKVDLIDIGIGNIGSMKRCLNNLDLEYAMVGIDNLPGGDKPIVLPGVGQFGAVMMALKRNKFDEHIRNLIQRGTPYLGICSGMQVLFDTSEESNGVIGLGLVAGNVIRFQKGKIPQIGWNKIHSLTEPNNEPQYAYFVNSYYPQPAYADVISHTANYFGEFCAAIKTKNITAAQFHPEKSANFGMQFLKRWIDDNK